MVSLGAEGSKAKRSYTDKLTANKKKLAAEVEHYNLLLGLGTGVGLTAITVAQIERQEFPWADVCTGDCFLREPCQLAVACVRTVLY